MRTVSRALPKKTDCPICLKINRIELLDSSGFSLYLCKTCKNGFISPVPRNLSDYYPKIYWQHQGRFSKIRDWLHTGLQEDRAHWFKNYLTKGHVLDVGSGEGIFGKTLGNNFNTTNLEYPGAQVENKSVIKKDFLSWKTNLKFDGIVFLESLEHVPNPQKYLKKASSLLKKGGYIFVEYPRFSSFESKLLGKYWLQRDIPRHLFHFTEEGLRILAKRESLKVVEQKGLMSFQYSPYCLLASFVQIVKLPSLNLRLGIIKNIPTLLFLAIGAPIAFILETFFYLIGESPLGLIVLRKT